MPETPGGVNFAPLGVKGFGIDGGLKILTISGNFYSASYIGEPTGTYDFLDVKLQATLPVADVQGFAYVRGGVPGFPVDTLLVAEYRAGAIAAYDVDAKGDPLPWTRRTFFSGPPFARPEGLVVDPQTGDLLVSTHSSSTSGIYRISGFTPAAESADQFLSEHYRAGLLPSNGQSDGAAIRELSQDQDLSNVHLDCRGYTVEAWDTPIQIDRVNGFSVRNCKLALQAPPGDYLHADNSRKG